MAFVFIDGIENYCDRWCERCPLAARCRLFAMERKTEASAPPEWDLGSRGAFDGRGETFLPTLATLRRFALERKIDVDRIDLEEIARLDPGAEVLTAADLLYKAAFIYAMRVHDWLTEYDAPGPSGSEEAADAVEIVRWYQFFIAATLHRVAQQEEQGTPELVPIAHHDVNGAAKVVLCAIDRSIAAWCQLLHEVPDSEKQVLDLLVRLTRLRTETERAFPQARSFLRPGFDTMDDERCLKSLNVEPSPA